ncbi:hypothetical protein [Bacillus taeanensis]|uniref:Uncharacterized protein n=1 Tax=Bacillus taeanensis TaxID=273032 RepID=A0A366XYN4_9BACI|nr:hypothetical protein [Bacillus taeanensis]RBW69263.1 hypothetical protein DS031_12860 [Bacillus taeanensis]
MTAISRNSYFTLCLLLLLSTLSLSHHTPIHHTKAFVDENMQLPVDLYVKDDHKNSKFLASLTSLVSLNSVILLVALTLRRLTFKYPFSLFFLLAVFYQSSYFRRPSFTP